MLAAFPKFSENEKKVSNSNEHSHRNVHSFSVFIKNSSNILYSMHVHFGALPQSGKEWHQGNLSGPIIPCVS